MGQPKRILVACGTAIATSTVVARAIEEALAAREVDLARRTRNLAECRGGGDACDYSLADPSPQTDLDEDLLGALVDMDDDGDQDLYVANDGGSNRLYINEGTGRFKDETILSGTGYSEEGRGQAARRAQVPDGVLRHRRVGDCANDRRQPGPGDAIQGAGRETDPM